MNLALGKRF